MSVSSNFLCDEEYQTNHGFSTLKVFYILILYYCYNFLLTLTHTILIAQLVKNPPAMQETPVRFLGWEDPLEKG